MKFNKSELSGTKQVFTFTLRQFMKSKSGIILSVIMLLIALLSVPVVTLISGGKLKEKDYSPVKQVYLINETPYALTGESMNAFRDEKNAEDEYYSKTVFTDASFTMDDLSVKDPASNQTETELLAQYIGTEDVLVYALLDEDGFYFYEITLPESSVSEDEQDKLYAFLQEAFAQVRYDAHEMTKEQLDILSMSISAKTDTVESYLKNEDENMGMTTYFLQLIFSIFVMMVSVYSISYIVRSVIEEKASKLVEFMVVSIKPLALIVGKILAALVYVIGFFLSTVLCVFISYKVTASFMDVSTTSALLKNAGFSTDLFHISPLFLLATLISLILAVLTFAIISGISASGCSTMENVQDATGAGTIFVMICYFVCIIASATNSDIVMNICCICPVISVFSAPVYFLLGKISFWILLLSWILQIIVVVLLARMAAGIYQNLILYRGERVGFFKSLSYRTASGSKAKKGDAHEIES